jgi:hypothetical protein
MRTEIQITIPEQISRGESIEIDCKLNVDLTDYKIRAELYDQFYASLRFATDNTGGADAQIEVTDEDKGEFTIHVLKNTTNIFHLISYIEIEIEDSHGVMQTVYFGLIKFLNDFRPIKWITP